MKQEVKILVLLLCPVILFSVQYSVHSCTGKVRKCITNKHNGILYIQQLLNDLF